MAFSELFAKLPDIEGELEDPNSRNDTNGQEASSKRKPQTTLSGPNVKRQCLQPYAAGNATTEDTTMLRKINKIETIKICFYNSLETPVDEGALIPEAEQTADTTEDDKESLPSALDQPGPVCYSVEAVLGPRFSKPYSYAREAPNK